jgi:hypothetical protein
LSRSVPRFASVSGYWEVASLADPAVTETWLAVDLLDLGAAGWFQVPPGMPIETLVGGAYCQPDRDLHRFEQGDAGAPAFRGLCLAAPREDAESPLYGVPGDESTPLGPLTGTVVILKRVSMADETWVGVWLEDRKQYGWIRENEARLLPEDCTALLAVETIAAGGESD